MTAATASWAPYRLNFRFEARTARERMRGKDTYFVRVCRGRRVAYGECALFRGLSADDTPDYEERLSYFCHHLDELPECGYSSIRFGLETALRNLDASAGDGWGGTAIPINGLVWMGDKSLMAERIEAKLADGFKVLKLKIGGIDFEDELDLLDAVRARFSPAELEIRLDANGSFRPDRALQCLERLSTYSIHSIEQPVAAKQPSAMRHICRHSPIPVALDEELIGCTSMEEKRQMLDYIHPSYIILKPALCGGLSGAEEWADAAESASIPYWFTSALESNIGLDAIARTAISRGIDIPQGLGTGELYTNNIISPISRIGASLHYDTGRRWEIPQLPWNI